MHGWASHAAATNGDNGGALTGGEGRGLPPAAMPADTAEAVKKLKVQVKKALKDGKEDHAVKRKIMKAATATDADADADAVKRMKAEDRNVNKPIWQIVGLFRRWFFEKAETKAGRIEALGMVVICLCRSAELTLQTRAVSWLDGTLQTRNIADFKVGLMKIVVLNLGGSFLRILYSYLQVPSLLWRLCSLLLVYFSAV